MWNDRNERFPHLSLLTFKLLAKPATSACVSWRKLLIAIERTRKLIVTETVPYAPLFVKQFRIDSIN
jgi:hypothetical protein